MNAMRLWALGAALAAASLPAMPQFVRGNEAVHIGRDGTRRVETPPEPTSTLAAPCAATNPGCVAAGWMMVETRDGLVECTEFYARARTCRPSTYGSRKLTRVWVVKSRGQWLQCQYPDIGSRCVRTNALPFDALQ